MDNLNNILFINTGGGIGDALTSVPTLNYINDNLKPKKLYYFSTDLGNFWFDTKLQEYKPDNLITVKSFPEHFGFRDHHMKVAKDVIKNFEFDEFDLIIDNQTRFKNTLIYRKIPHKYYVSPCLNYLMSKPITFMRKREIFANRIIDYLIENPQPKLKFAINTNACPPKKLWPQFIKKIKYLKENNCIEKFTLFVSAEAKGAQQEYSRYGMDWQLFVKNVNQYLREVDEDIIFMSAFNIFSFPTFLPFLKWISQLKAKYGERKVIISIPFVRNPGFLDAKIATPAMLAEYIIPCVTFMKMKNL